MRHDWKETAFLYAVGLDFEPNSGWQAAAQKMAPLSFKGAAVVVQVQEDFVTAAVWAVLNCEGQFDTADGYWAFEKYHDARRFRLQFG